MHEKGTAICYCAAGRLYEWCSSFAANETLEGTPSGVSSLTICTTILVCEQALIANHSLHRY
jgi:hypothetical protein